MRSLYGKMLGLLLPEEKRRFFLLLGMIMIMGLTEVLGVGAIMPFLSMLSDPGVIHENRILSAAYDFGGFESDRGFLIAFGLAVFCFILFSLAFKALTNYAIFRFTAMRSYSISSRMLMGYLDQPYAWFLGRNTAELGKNILAEVQQVSQGVMLPALRLIAYSVVAVFLVSLVILVDPVVALSALTVLGAIYVVLFLGLRRMLDRLGAERVVANGARFKVAQEATGGIKDVKVMNLERTFSGRFRQPAYRMAQILSISQTVTELPRFLIEALLFGGMLLFLLYMIVSGSGELTDVLPVVALYAFAGVRLFPAVQEIFRNLTRLRFGAPALDNLYADMREIEANAVVQPTVTAEPRRLKETLELRDVRYAYPDVDRSALDGLDLTIKAQTTVGLVGGTGAGKTTIVDIILGLLVPQEGGLVVDGEAVSGPHDLAAWRNSLGYVPQQIFLTDDTVSGNVAFGVPTSQIDHAAVEQAARLAELHSFVMDELPEGYDTMVGERGVRLSGGQRQRIGIARALYRNPDVLVLDEATSALDNLTERAVMDALHNLGNSKTVIMIAHRLTTVQACDQIFLLERGRIAAHGTYDQLMEKSGTFRKMATAGQRT